MKIEAGMVGSKTNYNEGEFSVDSLFPAILFTIGMFAFTGEMFWLRHEVISDPTRRAKVQKNLPWDALRTITTLMFMGGMAFVLMILVIIIILVRSP